MGARFTRFRSEGGTVVDKNFVPREFPVFPLHTAFISGRIYIAKSLIEEGVDITARNQNGNSAALLMFDRHFNVKPYSFEDCTRASLIGETLLKHPQFEINEQTSDGNTMLHIACLRQYIVCAEVLIGDPACDVTLKNKNGETALMFLFQTKAELIEQNEQYETEHVNVIKALLKRANNNNAKDDTKDKSTQLNAPHQLDVNDNGADNSQHHSDINANNGGAQYHQSDISGEIKNDASQQLDLDGRVDNGMCQQFDINRQNEDGDCILHHACKFGCLLEAKLIIEHPNCDIMRQNRCGDTALLLLCSLNVKPDSKAEALLLNVVACLLNHPSIDINHQNVSGNSALHIACRRSPWTLSLLRLIDILIGRCNVSLKNQKEETPLMLLCASQPDNYLQKLAIANYPETDINHQDKGGNSALHLACKYSSPDVIKLILSKFQCNVNLPNTNGDTAFMLLFSNQNQREIVEIIEGLLRVVTIDPNYQNQNGDSTLHLVFRFSEYKVIKLLIDAYECNFMLRNSNGDTALMLLCCRDIALRESDIKQIFDNITDSIFNWPIFDFNHQNENGDTVLHLACTPSNPQKLQRFGDDRRNFTRALANTGGQSRDCNITFPLADTNSHRSIARYILSTSLCDPNIQNNDGDSVLHIACRHLTPEFIHLIVSNNEVDSSLQNVNGDNALLILCSRKLSSFDKEFETVIEMLIPFCDINHQNRDGATALHLACKHSSAAVIRLILSNPQCNTALEDRNGDTALMIFCSRKIETQSDDGPFYANLVDIKHIYNLETGEDIVQTMLNVSRDLVDINHQNIAGDSAMHLACRNASAEVAKRIILNDKCNINIKNFRGESVLYILVERVLQSKDFKQEIETVQNIKDCITSASDSSSRITLLDLYLRQCSDLHEFKSSEDSLKEVTIFAMNKEQVSSKTLAIAINRNSFRVCKRIITVGAKVCSSTDIEEEENALFCALRLNSFRKTKLIMDLLSKEEYRKMLYKSLTPLQFAIANECNPAILELLSEKMEKKNVKLSIEKCCAVGESTTTSTVRLGVDRWISKFITSANMSVPDSSGLSPKDLLCKTAKTPDTKKQAVKEHMAKWYYNRKLCSFKLEPKNTVVVGEEHMKETIETVTNCRKNLKENQTETKQIENATLDVLRRVSNEMSSSENDSHFEFVPVLAGSMSEGTKCFYPDELDILCVFQSVDELQFQNRGSDYYRIFIRGTSAWRALCTDSYLEQGKVAAELYGRIEVYLQRLIEQNTDWGNLHLFKQPIHLGDKISKLKFLWRGEIFKDMTLYVDLVPAFLVPEHVAYCKIPLNVVVKDYYIIAKKSRHDHEFIDTHFRVTYSTAERAIIESLPPSVKNGFIFAKASRLPSVCRPDDEDLECMEEAVRTEDVLTSFLLKNCLFAILRKQRFVEVPPDHLDETAKEILPFNVVNRVETVIDGSVYGWVRAIYAQLNEYLTKKKIPSWSSVRGETLMNCTNCDSVKGCCRKMQLVRVLTKQIISWLQTYEIELRKNFENMND